MAKLSPKLFKDIVKQEVQLSIAHSRKNSERLRRGPLWAWIRGANGYGAYGIERVKSGDARFPWAAYNAAGKVLHKRLCDSHHISWVQKNWLMEFISQKYAGRYERDYTVLDDFRFREQSRQWALRCASEVDKFVSEQMKKVSDKTVPPLRVILSPEVTIAINIKFAEKFL